MKHRVVLALGAAAVVVLAACSKDKPSAGTGVAITATDDACQVARTTLDPGPVRFTVTNKGSKTTEVYVYGESGGAFTKVISEVENVAPGLSRDLTATLTAGRYEIACKPGQTGDGIRTPIKVTGTPDPGASTAEPAPDREIEIEVSAAGVRGGEGLSATAGQRIEFKLENTASAKRELVIVNPAGKTVAEIEAAPGGAAETVVTLIDPGNWTLRIEGDGMSEIKKMLTVT